MDEIVQFESEAGFRYDGIDPKVAAMLRHTAKMVAREVAYQSSSILRVGQQLIRVKGHVEHGLFTRYVECELGFTVRTAQNYMRAAGLLAETKRETVSRLAPGTLYLLAAMPEDARASALTALAAEDADIRAIEADIRSARLSAEKPAAVSERIGRDRAALQEIADLLWSNLAPDAYQRFCELIQTVSGHNGSLMRDLRKMLADRQAHH